MRQTAKVLVLVAIVALVVSLTLGCTGQAAQDSPKATAQATAQASVQATPQATQQSITQTIIGAIGGKQDLMAPYKNADGTFKKDVTITDESLNKTVTAGALMWAFFSGTHPDIQNMDINTTTNRDLKIDMKVYQENKYKAVIFNMTGVKETSTGKVHNYDVCVIVREANDEPLAYIGYAALDGRNLLPTYPSGGFSVPTRLTVGADKLVD